MLAMPFQPYRGQEPARYSENAFQPRSKSIRNPKDPVKKAAIIRRRKAKRLSELSKPKRRAVYYYNLRHLVKKYA
jgi:hypothetical protein